MLKQATSECTICGAKFHQIDSTEERALAIVEAAQDKHQLEAHPERTRS